MAEPSVELEVERLMNLIRGFGWTERERRVDAGEVVVTIFKKVVSETPPPPT